MKARPVAQRILVRLIQIGALGVAAASVLGHFSRHHFLLELCSHFRLQYAVLLIGAALGLFILRSWKLAGIAALIALMNTLIIAPRLLPAAKAASPHADAATIRLLVQNVNTANAQHQLVLELIEREDPDVILLLEVDRRWMESLRSLDDRYAHAIASPREDNFGIALWSRVEWRNARIEPMTGFRVPMVVAEMVVGGRPLRFLGAHTLPPVRRSYAEARNEQLRQMADLAAADANRPIIICGDLNVTPWSGRFRDLLRDGLLGDTARGFGMQRTWPASSFLLRIPIDHVLTTPGVICHARRVAPPVGSDHLGLIAELSVLP